MDPVSITASVITIADVAHKIARYISRVKDASADLVSLMRLTDPANSSSPLVRCHQELNNIVDVLEKDHCGPPGSKRDGIFKAALFPLKEKEITRTRERINIQMNSLATGLKFDEADLAMDTNSRVRSIDRQAQSIQEDLKNDQVLKWLNAPGVAQDHHRAKEKRGAETTGRWLIESDDYASWKTQPQSIYWLHGMLGCGKTILASTIVDDLFKDCGKSSSSLAYFYCSDRHDCSRILRSLLQQLSSQNRDCSRMLQDFYVTLEKGQKQPSRDTMSTLLRAMVTISGTSFIVLDALDECKPRGELMQFIEDIASWHDAPYHMLMTSRSEHDIRTTVESLSHKKYIKDIQKSLNREDIRTHIRYRLAHDKELEKWQNNSKALEEIEVQLMEKADGMFLLADHQLDALRYSYTWDMLIHTLTSLPATLNDQYARILGNMSTNDRKLAIKAFQWVIHSATPIGLDEMVDILATDATINPAFSVNRRLIDREDILQICSNLIDAPIGFPTGFGWRQRPGQPTLRLAHLSVKEYLMSNHILETSAAEFAPKSSDVHATIAQDCLAYLMNAKDKFRTVARYLSDSFLEEFSPNFWKSAPEAGEAISTEWQNKMDSYENEVWIALPLLFYAAEYWPHHVRLAGPGHDSLDQSVFRAFEPDNFESWKLAPDPLRYAIERQLLRLVQHLLEQGTDMNSTTCENYDPLSAAATTGNLEMVILLRKHGADRCASAAGNAAWRGFSKIIEFLLDERTDMNLNPLFYAAIFVDSVPTARMLIAKGAKVDASFHDNTHFEHALGKGHPEMVQLLLSNEVSANIHVHRDALSLAAWSGLEEVVRQLLDAGFDVNARTPGAPGKRSKIQSRTALLCAAEGKRQSTVELLIERGADVNLQTDVSMPWRTVLQRACSLGWIDTVRLLLKSGADISIRGGDHESAFQAACAAPENHDTVLPLLIQHGADVNESGGPFGSPLQCAAHFGRDQAIPILLEHGACINHQRGECGNALQAALEHGHGYVAHQALAAGADRNKVKEELQERLEDVQKGIKKLKWREELVEIITEDGKQEEVRRGSLPDAIAQLPDGYYFDRSLSNGPVSSSVPAK
ncbi:MAG: hypothetical protein Q9168_007488 [Polycauliona sp. 1 TL-2023]